MDNILTDAQLDSRKKAAHDSEIRQNVKSHCTKIRDGIRKNGSTSGNRAIWELFQNAGDLAKDASTDIKITLTDNAFVFAHKGKPFTYDSLCSLVKQVSSQEKENEETVGQYGTGFLTTHKFSRKITINGSMCICDEPETYVNIDDFVVNRENFDNIPQFIDDMFIQIKNVESLMDGKQYPIAREWTTLSYELNDERKCIAQTAIDEAKRLMPYVLTFNDNIRKCTIIDDTRNFSVSFVKQDKDTKAQDLYCKRINICKDGEEKCNIDCFYLETHNGASRIILPLSEETKVRDLRNVPRFFVHYPLIGADNFNVNFLFHSHLFTPEEPRDNIVLPKSNDAIENTANRNLKVLQDLTDVLWKFLENNIETWENTIEMASIKIKDWGYEDSKTEDCYKKMKEQWVREFSQLKLIEIDGSRFSLKEEGHPLVLEPALESFISDNNEKDYLSILYPYASKTALIPCKEELMMWSKIIAEWNVEEKQNFLTLEKIVGHVCGNYDTSLHDLLKMIVDAGKIEFFDKYSLIPNREGELRKREELRDAMAVTKDLYELVKPIDDAICEKMVDVAYSDIIKLAPYSRQDLRDELNTIIKKKEDECWNESGNQRPYGGDFEKKLIDLCSAFTTQNGDSKRNKLMPIICRFEGLKYKEHYIPAWESDASGFDLYRQLFLSLVENQMMKIETKEVRWVKDNIDDLVTFVDVARGDDYKSFCTRYAIYPDMNWNLHSPDSLKKNYSIKEELFDLYQRVFGEDLKNKCVEQRFESLFSKYAEETYTYTPHSVAREIQNKLSEENYKNTIVLDIIELTENNSPTKAQQWQLLFKDIYDQRESIRYNLGSEMERKAINTMLKQNNPGLMQKMAEVAERKDANTILDVLDNALANIEHEAYIKMLGDYVENHLQSFLTEELAAINVAVRNEQGGQDLILSKDGYDDYYIEIKSRWADKESAIMSSTQFHKAIDNSDRYALISAQMWYFDKQRVERKENISLSELKPLIKANTRIGSLEKGLLNRMDDAFKYDNEKISAVGSYEIHVPQKLFDLSYDELVEEIKTKFE